MASTASSPVVTFAETVLVDQQNYNTSLGESGKTQTESVAHSALNHQTLSDKLMQKIEKEDFQGVQGLISDLSSRNQWVNLLDLLYTGEHKNNPELLKKAVIK